MHVGQSEKENKDKMVWWTKGSLIYGYYLSTSHFLNYGNLLDVFAELVLSMNNYHGVYYQLLRRSDLRV